MDDEKRGSRNRVLERLLSYSEAIGNNSVRSSIEIPNKVHTEVYTNEELKNKHRISQTYVEGKEIVFPYEVKNIDNYTETSFNCEPLYETIDSSQYLSSEDETAEGLVMKIEVEGEPNEIRKSSYTDSMKNISSVSTRALVSSNQQPKYDRIELDETTYYASTVPDSSNTTSRYGHPLTKRRKKIGASSNEWRDCFPSARTLRSAMIKISPAFIKQLWLTFGASLAFLIIGLVRGYSASALPSIEKIDPNFIETNEQKSWIGAIPPLGAFLGSMISGALMQRAGRRRTLQLTAPLWAGGWLLLGFAPNLPSLLAGRFTCGFCVGLSLAPTQVYVSECCDPEIRGRLGSLPTLSMSLGILISYIAGNWLYWRYLAFLSAAFCAALFIVLLPLPESPVWLQAHGLDPAKAIAWLHLSPRATAQINNDDRDQAIKKPEEALLEESLFSRKVFFSSIVIKPLVVGFSLLFFQQFSGIDAVIFFTVEIFQSAGSTLDAMTATILVGLVQLLSNAVSTVLVDRSGRRPLLLVSAAVMCASMASMGAAYYFDFKSGSWLGYLPVGSLLVFMVGFSLGFGGLPFLLLGELFPAHHRSQLSAMASAVNLLSMFTVIKSYHSLDALLTSAGTFWMYSCFCAVAFFFVLLMVPETKGKTLAEIEQHFRSNTKKENKVNLAVISK